MTNQNDSFIDEVAEEVRRDRLYRHFRRYGWIGIVAVLLIVGGAALFEYRRGQAEALAEATGDALYAALQAPEGAERAEALAALDVPASAAPPAAMLRAASLVEAGDADAAAEVLGALAADATAPRVWRDLAALKRVLILGASLEPAARLTALEPLAAAGAPYRVLAVEQQALARAEMGEREAAIALLDGLIEDQQATLGLRLRAAQLIVALGGEEGEGS